MYLTVSFLNIPKYNEDTNMYAYYIDKSDDFETDDNFYALVTDQEPIDDIEICSKIPDEIVDEIKNYFFVINSKDGYKSSREDIIIFNTIYSHLIEEFDNDITNYIPNDFKETYIKQMSEKKIYYNYTLCFENMKVNNGKLNDFSNFLSEIKTSHNYHNLFN